MPACRSTATQSGDDRSLSLDHYIRHQTDQEEHQGKNDQQQECYGCLHIRDVHGTEFQGCEERTKNVCICQVRGVALQCICKLIIQLGSSLRKRWEIICIKMSQVKRIAPEEDKLTLKIVSRRRLRLQVGH